MQPDRSLRQACLYSESLAGRFAEWVNAHPAICWIVFSALYFGTGVPLATRRNLWFDELVTFHVSRLPDLSSLWMALSKGADASPPLFHVISRAAFALLGGNPLAARAPALLGFWLMSLCVYLFLRRRGGALWAWVAAILPLATGAEYFSVEARPYGLVLGFSALALLAWQKAKEDGAGWMPAAGLGLTIAAAVSCHYYAVFLSVALGTGELYRTFARRKPDWRLWAGLFFGIAPLALVVPLLRAGAVYAGDEWSAVTPLRVTSSYVEFFRPTVLPAIAVLLASAAWLTLRGRDPETATPPDEFRIPPDEVAAGIGLALWPLLAGIFGIIVTGIYVSRYSLPAVIGFSVLAAFFLQGTSRQRTALATLTLGILVIYSFALRVKHAAETHPRPDWSWVSAAAKNRGARVVVANPITYLEASYQADPEVRSRLWYAPDPVKSMRYTGNRSAELGLLNLRRWAPVQVEEADVLLRRRRTFYLLTVDGLENWLLRDLLSGGAEVELRAEHSRYLLYCVTQRGD